MLVHRQDPEPRAVEAKRTFVVVRARGPAWERELPMEGQVEWPAHAAFMEGLAERGAVQLGGPLSGTDDVLLVILAKDTAEIAERLAEDPWTRKGLLVLKECRPWEIRLGSLPGLTPAPSGSDG